MSSAGSIFGGVIRGIGMITSYNAMRRNGRGAGRWEAEQNKMFAGSRAYLDQWGERAGAAWKSFSENYDKFDKGFLDELTKRTMRSPEMDASRAVGDVEEYFGRANESRIRESQRRGGYDPTSGSESQALSTLARDKTRLQVGAANQAREDSFAIRDKAYRAIHDLGNEQINRAVQFGGISESARRWLAGQYGDRAGIMRDRQAAAAQTFGRALQSTSSAISSWASGSSSPGSSKPSGSPSDKPSESGVIADDAVGPPYKDGGVVRGPGGPRSDKVQAVVDGKRPVRLSAGEFIVPEQAVRYHGVKVFKKLIEEAQEGAGHG